jgi:hypothetical protein
MEFVLRIFYSVQFILFHLEGFQNMDYHYFSSVMISTYFPYLMSPFILHYGHEILVKVLIIYILPYFDESSSLSEDFYWKNS